MPIIELRVSSPASCSSSHPSVPVGKDETENRVVREEGTKRGYDFAPKPHWDLGTALNIIDFDRGV